VGVGQADPAGGEARLAALVAEARAAWPDLVDEAALRQFVAERSGRGELPGAPPADLALAAAVLAGHPAAPAAFERALIAPLVTVLGRRYPAELIGEVQQRLRIQLLVEGGLASYQGRGPLGAWVRVVAVREAERARRALGGELPDDEVGALAGRAIADPERLLLRAATREAVHAALRRALEALAPRQRTLLRYHYVDRLGIDRIAPLFAVHRATAARWLEQARQDLLRHARQALAGKLALMPEELASLGRVLESQLYLSLSRLFAASR
jgi:RNA polymerase sigma-70 factor (ECF subfamily)